MQNVKCPQCGTLNRPSARFCGNCRAPMQAQATPLAPQQRAPQAPVQSPQQIMLPAQAALQRVSPVVTRGCGAVFSNIAKFFTFGGRAAYADLIAPQVAAQGLVASQPIVKSAPAPLEVGCFAWAIFWLLGALTLLVSRQDWLVGIALFIGCYLVLIVLSLIGLRRPFFSRLTVNTLANLVTGAGRGTQPELEFTLAPHAQNQNQNQMLVTVIGEIKDLKQSMPIQGHAVQVWGIATGSKTMRAWRLEFLDQQYQPAGVFLTTARVISLNAALLIPVTVWLIIWLIVKVWLAW